jgi:hypothetical protein
LFVVFPQRVLCQCIELPGFGVDFELAVPKLAIEGRTSQGISPALQQKALCSGFR